MTTLANIRWFEAEFEGGSCGACREPIKRSMRIGYIGYGSNRILVGFECCQGEGHDDESYVLPAGDEEPLSIGDDEDGALRITNVRAVMPPGRNKTDSCTKCFTIHTQAQGSECW